MSTVPTQYWHKLPDERIQCDLCPRSCKLREGQQGLCFIRERQAEQIVLTSYGRSSGFCIDPIEKKPLNHFYPGSSVLSFGTAGCNLACKFCQNWDISSSRQIAKLAKNASPEQIAATAHFHSCKSVAFTYNDPVIFHEYAIDVAQAAQAFQIKSVAVTAGYMCPQPRQEFFQFMHAANVDLKAFSEDFYYRLTGGHLQPVLDTLLYIKLETEVWLEITTLLIPGKNDSSAEIDAMTKWIAQHLGPDVPLHFSAFHPDWKMQDIPATPLTSLLNAHQIAKSNGLHHVYLGNVHNKGASSTYCAKCGNQLIGRNWYELSEWNLDSGGKCTNCGHLCVGLFDPEPGNWGAKRLPVEIATG